LTLLFAVAGCAVAADHIDADVAPAAWVGRRTPNRADRWPPSAEWNKNPRPFLWPKTANEILETLAAYGALSWAAFPSMSSGVRHRG